MAIRTDLAVEMREMYCESHRETADIPGVRVETDEPADGVSVTRIEIFSEEGAGIMGKPPGNYITVEARDVSGRGEEYRMSLAKVLAGELRRLIPFDYHLKVMVAGLGNERITPDSLGPATVGKVHITRHYFVLMNEDGSGKMACVSGFCPGVMGTTGLESAEMIRQAAQVAEPDVIIAVDSLAARNISRINSTIQISDTGISPGSGTGNMRKAINSETTGVKVVAIGIPTVIDARTIIIDTMKRMGKPTEQLEEEISREKVDMIVTSSNIDRVISDFAEIIAEAINMTLHPGLY